MKDNERRGRDMEGEIEARSSGDRENGLVTAEQIELDRIVRAGLCTRPASGPDGQSIDEAARELIDEIAMEGIMFGHAFVEPKHMAAMAILDPIEPDSWERMRNAAAFLSGERTWSS